MQLLHSNNVVRTKLGYSGADCKILHRYSMDPHSGCQKATCFIENGPSNQIVIVFFQGTRIKVLPRCFMYDRIQVKVVGRTKHAVMCSGIHDIVTMMLGMGGALLGTLRCEEDSSGRCIDTILNLSASWIRRVARHTRGLLQLASVAFSQA